MGLFFRPRRPLLRLAAGAATATVAYNAGRNRAEQEQPPPEYRPPAPAGPPPNDRLDELVRLARLHDSGAIDDAEFATMKSRLIGG
ncbi:MAG TPA: SHOCT domain-containing protein [Streptosporangiaceae bacterium]|jgi:hypothetical protein